MEQPLAEIVLGLGTGDGYTSSDVTAPATAVRAGEVPVLRGPGHGQRVLELRVHGVGGAPPTENLESPSVVQVSGDGTAGCYRAWYPGVQVGPEVPRREAYCWGKLNYQNASRALWLLLMPFALLNVAHWALPDSAARWLQPVSRAVLRLLALVLTAAFIATTAFVLVDLIAWQAAQNDALWSWLGWYQKRSLGVRMAISLFGTLGVLALLILLSQQTEKANESWHAGTGADDDPSFPLSASWFWQGARTLRRQRYGHVIIGAAVVLYVGAQPHGSHGSLRIALLWLSAVFAAGAAVVVAAPWSDRITAAGPRRAHPSWIEPVLAMAAVVAAVAVSVSRIWWRPLRDAAAIPWDTTLQLMLVFVTFALVAVLIVLVLAQRPNAQPDVMGRGYNGASLALLASVISAIFGGALTLVVANFFGQPTVTKPRPSVATRDNLYTLPTSVYAGGLAFLVALIVSAVVGVTLFFVIRRRLAHRFTPEVVTTYQGHGSGADTEAAAAAVATSWATGALTDYVAVSLCCIALPTAVVLVWYEAYLHGGPGASWLRTAASIGSVAGVFATAAFLNQIRLALTSATARKRFGFFWDVVTFWPRAAHPLGPPCYAERSIPELVTRIRRVVGGECEPGDPYDPAVALQAAEAAGDPDPALRERHSPLLLVGYSQGTPISVATLAQLPAAVRSQVALLTLAAPVRRLYGRAFPAYFGPDQLAKLVERLRDDDGTTRWCNLVRRTDFIGGWVISPPAGTTLTPNVVDTLILDPPVVWPVGDPGRPPTHTHMVWFADPQTRPAASYLTGLL